MPNPRQMLASAQVRRPQQQHQQQKTPPPKWTHHQDILSNWNNGCISNFTAKCKREQEQN